MNYSREEIAVAVSKKKRHFTVAASVMLTLLAVAAVLLILNINDTLSFIMIVLILLLLHCTASTFAHFQPRVLFSKEIEGVNIREDLYHAQVRSGPGLRHKQVGSSGLLPFAPNTGENKKKSHSLRGAVYIRTDDGNVCAIRGLSETHVEIFEDGDKLLKLSGTNYPIILNRDEERQPCPLCGAVNGQDRSKCIGCGVSIVN